MAAAAKNLTPVVLELGGKDAGDRVPRRRPRARRARHRLGRVHERRPDLRLGRARLRRAAGGRGRSWRRCSSETRRAAARRPGAGEGELGPMTLERQRRDRGGARGGRGGAGAPACCSAASGRAGPGHFYPPTVLTDVDHTWRIMREETFGPGAADHGRRLARRGDPPGERQRLRPHGERLDAQRRRPRAGCSASSRPASSRSTTTSRASASRRRPGAASRERDRAHPRPRRAARDGAAEVREPRPRARPRAVVVPLRRRARGA